jgi:hypothetical protein
MSTCKGVDGLVESLQEFMAFQAVQLDCHVHFDQEFGQFD